MTFPFPTFRPIPIGDFINVGTDRTLSLDGDIIFCLQRDNTATLPALAAGFTNITTFTVEGTNESGGGDFNPIYQSIRASYAVSSSATRTVSVAGDTKVYQCIGSPYGSGIAALTVSGSLGSGVTSLASFSKAACLIEIGATYASTIGRYSTAEWTNGSINSDSNRDTFIELDDKAAGNYNVGVFDIEISLWLNNYKILSPVTLTYGTGDKGDDFREWRAVSFV